VQEEAGRAVLQMPFLCRILPACVPVTYACRAGEII